MDSKYVTAIIPDKVLSVINDMSLAFLDLLEIEFEDGTLKPARYLIEDGKITAIFTEE